MKTTQAKLSFPNLRFVSRWVSNSHKQSFEPVQMGQQKYEVDFRGRTNWSAIVNSKFLAIFIRSSQK